MLAADIGALVAWRALQGVGMAAAVVCARAMVRDLYVPADGARVMSKALSGLGLIALASPLLGGVLASTVGWRAALAAIGVFGAACLAMVALAMPETLRARNPDALRLAPMLAQWGRILRHPTFIAWALLIACTYGGLFAFLAGSSFVFIDVLGGSRLACGLYIAGCSISYIVGTFWCRRWLPRHGLAGAVKRGAAFTLAGGAVDGGPGLGRRASGPGRSSAAVRLRLRPRHPPALRPGGRGRAVSAARPAPRRRWPASCSPRPPWRSAPGWAWRWTAPCCRWR